MSTPDLETILAHECRVWDALVRGDFEADIRLLDDRFLGVYDTGFADRAAHAEPLRLGPRIAVYRLEDARLLVLRPDVVILAYRAVFRRSRSRADDAPERMYVSSAWQIGPEGWRNIFSQDTGAA